MNSPPDRNRRRVEVVLIIAILLIGWYISRPDSPNGPRELLHWPTAALAAWFLGGAAWSIITKPTRLFLALGYLMWGVSMSLQFIDDLAPAANSSKIEVLSLAAMFAGLYLFWLDNNKYGSAASP